MQNIIVKHKEIWNKDFFKLAMGGFVLFAISLFANNLATIFAAKRVSEPVTDIILSNVKIYDVDGVIVAATLFVFFFTILLLIADPKKIPFVFKTVALFILIRSIFIMLTHIGPFTPHLFNEPNQFQSLLGLGYAGDLFFSGHTGMPFLLALIFWHTKTIRWIFLVSSIILGISVLLGHLHYSIDVAAAYFITYTIFHLGQEFFPRDWKLSVT